MTLIICVSKVNNCLYGEGEWTGAAPHIPASQPIPEVILDTSTMGQEAVVVKNGLRLCGTGSARGSAPILQDKAYWEVKVQQGGRWSAGIATPAADLTKDLGLDHCRLGTLYPCPVSLRFPQLGGDFRRSC